MLRTTSKFYTRRHFIFFRMKKVKVTDALSQRVAMVGEDALLPVVAHSAMIEVREAAEHFAQIVIGLVDTLGKDNVNYGRLIAAVDTIQQAKYIAYDAITLPHIEIERK